MKLRRQAGVRMNGMLKAACVVVLILAATIIEIGCGATYRPVAEPLPSTTGNPAGAETEVVLNQCPSGSGSGCAGSVLTDINVSGDSNTGDKPLYNVAAGVVEGSVLNAGVPVNIPTVPFAFDFNRTTVFTANTATGTAPPTVTQVLLSSSTAGFAGNTNTITLFPKSNPIGITFEYFGSTYTQDYVIDASTATTTCPGVGSLDVIVQASAQLKAQACVGVNPVAAWIYRDQSKVFVLDKTENQVYVVNASTYEWTNKILVGVAPIKVAQSNNGYYIYVVNSGSTTVPSSVSIIDGTVETVVGTATPAPQGNPLCGAICNSPVIDIAQDTNYNDATSNTQINHVWLLHANGTVSVYDGTTPGQLHWITSLSTITAAQATAGVHPTNLALMRDGTGAYVGLGNTDQIVAINTSALATGAVTPGATTNVTVGVHRSISASLSYTYTDTTTSSVTSYTTPQPVLLETTTPVVTYVAVSRGGNSSEGSKAYATTTSTTTYYCYDYTGTPTDCANGDAWVSGNTVSEVGTTPTPPAFTTPFLVGTCTNLGVVNVSSKSLYAMSCPNLYNGTAIVSAAGYGTSPTYTPINTNLATILAPWQGTYVGPAISACTPMTDGYDQKKYCPVMVPVAVLGRS